MHNFVDTTRPIANFLSEKLVFKWSDEAIKEFKEVKIIIAKASVLSHLDYKKYFVIHCHTNEHNMSTVLLQEDTIGFKIPISFMSVPLKNYDMRYLLVEKYAFSFVKVVKNFSYYILHSHSTIFVQSSAVKSILTQKEVSINNRATWVLKF